MQESDAKLKLVSVLGINIFLKFHLRYHYVHVATEQ